MRRRIPARSPGGYLLLALGGVLLLLMALKAFDTARTMFGMFGWPFQYDESEGMIVVETLLLDRGTNIFAPITNQQFIAAPYPPLFYLLNLPFLHFIGPTFKVGRVITLLATGGVAVLLILVVQRATRNWWAGLAGALAWLSLALVGFWGGLVKPDMLAVAFGLAGVLVALSSDRGASRRIWWALPLFWAAFFTKQTAIAPALVVVVWLLLLRWRNGVAFGATLIGVAVGATGLFNFLTSGGYFYHEFTVHDLPWFADQYWGFVSDQLAVYWPLLGLGSIALLGWGLFSLARWVQLAGGIAGLIKNIGSLGKIKGAAAEPSAGILLLGYLAASLVTSSGAGTHGGNHNHLLEWAAASCIGFGLLVHLLLSRQRAATQAVAALGLLLLALYARPPGVLTELPSLYTVPSKLVREYRIPPDNIQEAWTNMAQYTSNTAGTVYSTDIGLLLATDKWRERLWTTDPFTQTHATYYGRWDESALIAAIRSKQFALIVLPYDPRSLNGWLATPDLGYGSVSHGILEAVRDAYTIDQRNLLFIYKPKP